MAWSMRHEIGMLSWMVEVQVFVQCQHDPCVFIRAQLVVGVHTDDILATGPTEQLRSYGEALSKRFSVRGGGTPGLWCGMELKRATQWPFLCFHGELHQAID